MAKVKRQVTEKDDFIKGVIKQLKVLAKNDSDPEHNGGMVDAFLREVLIHLGRRDVVTAADNVKVY